MPEYRTVTWYRTNNDLNNDESEWLPIPVQEKRTLQILRRLHITAMAGESQAEDTDILISLWDTWFDAGNDSTRFLITDTDVVNSRRPWIWAGQYGYDRAGTPANSQFVRAGFNESIDFSQHQNQRPFRKRMQVAGQVTTAVGPQLDGWSLVMSNRGSANHNPQLLAIIEIEVIWEGGNGSMKRKDLVRMNEEENQW